MKIGMPLLMLERLTFRFVTAGFVLLTATLLAGWLFGESLYGRAWHWDHKTVFSLLAWFAFAGLLIGRSRFGLRGRHAVHLIYAGAALLLLAYAGSRFVVEVVMLRTHVMKYVLVALVVIIAIGIWRNNRRKAAAAQPFQQATLAPARRYGDLRALRRASARQRRHHQPRPQPLLQH